jgi:steroid 5-alpha reductase family enzyme
MSAGLLIAVAFVALVVIFLAVFGVARRLNNYGVVDIAWAYAFAGVALGYGLSASGWWVRRVFIVAMVVVWSLRLGTHLYRRVMSHHPEEDGRYRQLRRDWQNHFAAKMVGFFQLQAISVVLLATPFLVSCLNPEPRLHLIEYAGLFLWLVGLTGEATADAQLAAFKRGPENRHKVCAVGLWRYSRHPNYFFEWMIWVSYFVFALGSPYGWTGVISPAIILYLLLRVSGIPATEEQAVRSKGDAYRRYQQITSAFVPWPRRHDGRDR